MNSPATRSGSAVMASTMVRTAGPARRPSRPGKARRSRRAAQRRAWPGRVPQASRRWRAGRRRPFIGLTGPAKAIDWVQKLRWRPRLSRLRTCSRPARRRCQDASTPPVPSATVASRFLASRRSHCSRGHHGIEHEEGDVPAEPESEHAGEGQHPLVEQPDQAERRGRRSGERRDALRRGAADPDPGRRRRRRLGTTRLAAGGWCARAPGQPSASVRARSGAGPGPVDDDRRELLTISVVTKSTRPQASSAETPLASYWV